MGNSVGVDFYSKLLGRKHVYASKASAGKESTRDKQIGRLADYLLESYFQQTAERDQALGQSAETGTE